MFNFTTVVFEGTSPTFYVTGNAGLLRVRATAIGGWFTRMANSTGFTALTYKYQSVLFNDALIC